MNGRQRPLIKAADEQIRHLAKRSEELSQETRVSVYYFGETTIECLIFDMDVARLPSIQDLYEVLYENTALIDAIMKSQDDLATTSQLYGDHAFLTFVLTDGQENKSKKYRASDLRNKLASSDVNWSIGFLVPDNFGVRDMENLGVLRDSIAIWDTTSATGLNTAVSAIKTATDNFMNARARGERGTKSVFRTGGVDAVNKQTVTQTLTPLNNYAIYSVNGIIRIDTFVNNNIGPYKKGKAYYELVKTETVQRNKDIIVVDKSTNAAYGGAEARHLIGLPDGESVRVRPEHNPLYDIFLQSTSLNRKLHPNTKLLVRN